MQGNFDVNMSIDSIEKQREFEQKNNHKDFKKKVEFNEKNYLNLKLANGQTKKTVRIRILNITPTSSTPFLVLKTHSLKVDRKISESGFKSFVCLKNHNENEVGECPLCKKSKELFELANRTSNEQEKKSLLKSAFSYQPKTTYILRVIDRDHEDEGVKFWRFNAHSDGSGCYDYLMQIYDERMKEHVEAGLGEYNVFDFNNGKDFVITVTKIPNTNKTSIQIVDAGLETPLSRDVEKAMGWINDTKVWSDMYSTKSADYLSVIADGKIPVRDKTTGKYIADEENKKNEAEIQNTAEKILEDFPSIGNNVKPQQFNDDNLPF